MTPEEIDGLRKMLAEIVVGDVAPFSPAMHVIRAVPSLLDEIERLRAVAGAFERYDNFSGTARDSFAAYKEIRDALAAWKEKR